MHGINTTSCWQGEQRLIQRAPEPAVYLRRKRRSTSILQVWGVYIGFKCHKTLRWQALWDVIKRKYDWSAVEQWRRCLWDGLWLCLELAAKSIDPDAIAVCTTNTRAFMYLSCLEAADNLSKLTHSSLKWNVYIFVPFSHFHGFILDILAPASGDRVVFIFNVASTEVEVAQMNETDFKCAAIPHRRSAMTRFISCPGVFEQNFNNAVCSQLSDDFGGPWAKRRRTQNDSMARIFITLSWGQLGIFTVFFICSVQMELLTAKDKGQPDVGWKKWRAILQKYPNCTLWGVLNRKFSFYNLALSFHIYGHHCQLLWFFSPS